MFRSRGLNFRRRRRKVSLDSVRQWIFLGIKIGLVLALAFGVVLAVGMRVTVVGSSMESTLSDGDTVFVDRLSYNLSEPKAGDLVVFLPNGNVKSHYYIKRVVAVPGDTVQIVDGVLYVNGEMYDEVDTEAIINAGLAQDEIVVGEGEYFVLGDNRNNSEDSRYANIGNVKKEYIIGRAWFYYDSIFDLGRLK